MAELLLNDDEHDRFGETVNIAMGRAGAALAEAFQGFVRLRVPEIGIVTSATLLETRERLIQAHERISVLHQELIGELAGDIAVIYGPTCYAALREVLGCDARDGDGPRQREELLLDLGNALAGALTGGIGELLGLKVGLRPPRVALFDVPAAEAAQRLFDDSPAWRGTTLQITVVFQLEDHALPFELLLTFAPDCLPVLRRALAAR